MRRTRVAAFAITALVVFAGAAGAMPVGQVSLITSGFITGSLPNGGVASGPDGNVWFADKGTGVTPATPAIGEMIPGGQVVGEWSSGLNAGSSPGAGTFGISTGPDGNVWFIDNGTTRAIGMINVATHQIQEFSLPSTTAPAGLTAAPDGNLWFNDNGTSKALVLFNPSTHQTQRFSSGLNVGASIGNVNVGPDGNVWFQDNGTPKAIGRIDLTTHAVTEFSSGLSTAGTGRPNPGPDGALWFVDRSATTPAVGRITAQGVITEFPVPVPAGQTLFTSAIGPDGALWVAVRTATFTAAFGRFELSTHAWTTYSAGLPQTAGFIGNVIVAGPDGNMWFPDANTPPGIGQSGTGAPAALVVPPAVSGSTPALTGQHGTQQTCAGAQWSTWAGEQPSLTAFGFDGYQWLLDGNPIAGQTGSSYTPTLADVGRPLSCRVTVTYRLLRVTDLATSNPVTVLTTAPVLHLPDDITAEATGPGGAVVTYTATATDLIDGSDPVTCSPAAGATFVLGTTTVGCSATDSAGNSSTGGFHVTVVDTTPPTLDLPADITVDATGPNGTAVTFVATATDLVDANDPVKCTPASGSTFAIGSTTIRCSATDAHGNTATGSFTVTVKGAAAQLIDELALVGMTGGGSFASQLQAVLTKLAAENTTAACGSLGAYVNHLQAQAGKQFSSSQATTLIANATRIETVIGC